MPEIPISTRRATDTRTNSEKLDDAGLLTDLAFAQHQETLDALPSEVVDEMIEAFNGQQPWRQSEEESPEPLS